MVFPNAPYERYLVFPSSWFTLLFHLTSFEPIQWTVTSALLDLVLHNYDGDNVAVLRKRAVFLR